MSPYSVIFVLIIFVLCASCYDLSQHRHRHSRHSSEYNLDRLMNRLDSHLPPSTAKPIVNEPATVASLDPENSLWDDDSLSLGDLSTPYPLDGERWNKILYAKEDEEKLKEKSEDEEDLLDERSEEEDGFEDQDEQADAYKTWDPNNEGESHTNWKWNNLGSRKSVDNLFQVYKSGLAKSDATNRESQPQYKVYMHNKIMSQETRCRWPKPKVVRILDIYPSTSKLYVPACTVLHQCGDDTGCCGGTGQTCGPKKTQRVELYFYTTYIVSSNNRQRTSRGLEKLPFYNHTECECIDKTDELMPRDGQGADIRMERHSDLGCRCPSEYTVRRLANGSCSCECFDKQRDCIKYKKGKEYFNHNDRLCIEMNTCLPPACDFGNYMRSSGRCPRKHEKYRSWSNRYH